MEAPPFIEQLVINCDQIGTEKTVITNIEGLTYTRNRLKNQDGQKISQITKTKFYRINYGQIRIWAKNTETYYILVWPHYAMRRTSIPAPLNIIESMWETNAAVEKYDAPIKNLIIWALNQRLEESSVLSDELRDCALRIDINYLFIGPLTLEEMNSNRQTLFSFIK
jgi:hypothetical protein